MNLSVFETVAVSEMVGVLRYGVNFYQTGLNIVPGDTYELAYSIGLTSGDVKIYQGNQLVVTVASTIASKTTFTANTTGNYIVLTTTNPVDLEVRRVGLRHVTPATAENDDIAEFLSGATDFGNAVHFRADTQVMQIQQGPELHSTPIAVVSELERGTQTKVYVSLDDKPFYQLEGTVTKGISILKFRPNQDGTDIAELTKTVQISYRDSSKNLCRIIQSAVITTPTPIDYSQ